MDVRGWVYIITNESLKGLVKIGYSLKDPKLRAKELRSSGVPNNYVVVYEILTINPIEVEKKIHSILNDSKYSKEWFNCSINEAINAINNVVKEKKIYEKYYCEQNSDENRDVNIQKIENESKLSNLEIYLKDQNKHQLKKHKYSEKECPGIEIRKHISLEDWMKGKREL